MDELGAGLARAELVAGALAEQEERARAAETFSAAAEEGRASEELSGKVASLEEQVRHPPVPPPVSSACPPSISLACPALLQAGPGAWLN